MAGTTVIRIEDVSKRFVIRKDKSLKERAVNFGRSRRHKDEFWALQHVNLEIESGSTVGLIGANGSGKSTLLKLIGGILQPTHGSVSHRGRLAALIELGAGFHPDLTGRENVYLNCAILGLSRQQTDEHFDAIVTFSGIERFIDTQVKFYSSGMYIRLAFAVAVHVDPDVLLVDEVLSVGDEAFQRKCLDRIRSFQAEGRTIVIVSHALDQIAELCDRAVVLEHGVVQVDGAPRLALKHLRAEFEETRQEEREQERVAAVSQHASRARVVGATLLDPAGNEASHITTGDALVIRVSIEADEPVKNWILGVSIDSMLGQVVYGTNTRLMDTALPTIEGAGSVDLLLEGLALGEGIYTVHAAVAEESGLEIDRMLDAATLTVEADGRGVGLLSARARVRVHDVAVSS